MKKKFFLKKKGWQIEVEQWKKSFKKKSWQTMEKKF
jgi:hypothetical protein